MPLASITASESSGFHTGSGVLATSVSPSRAMVAVNAGGMT